jgi:hypothetical protein
MQHGRAGRASPNGEPGGGRASGAALILERLIRATYSSLEVPPALAVSHREPSATGSTWPPPIDDRLDAVDWCAPLADEDEG